MAVDGTIPTLLLVDDERISLRMLEAALDTGDYTLLTTTDPVEALTLACEHRPHLLLLDVVMPGMDGFTLCQQLRAEARTKDIPVIFLSSLQDPADRVRGLELGAVDFISKPFNTAEIRARVRRHVDLHDERMALLRNRPAESPEERMARILAAGENDRTEFKSTLRFSIVDKKIDHGVEIAWLKSIAAFLNTDGGNLVVGVDDKGTPLGIELDGFDNEDKYLLHVNNRIQQHIGAECAAHVRFGLYPVAGKKVLLVECAAASKPVFLTDAGQEAFYIRVGPGTRKLTMSQILAYVVARKRI
jgi:DNA-binding response OmpR family regulator